MKMLKIFGASVCLSLMMTAAAPVAVYAQSAPAQSAPAGFTSIFDGKTLEGWTGDTTVWAIRDGAITGGTDQPTPFNTYLIYEKPYANFELRYKYRWGSPLGNSGFQFRSAIAEGHYALAGYQANVIPTIDRPERYGMLYSELTDRQEIALLGQKVELTRRTATGGGTARIVRTVKEMVNSREDLIGSLRPYPEWNEVVVIAYGNRIVSSINGLLAFDALDLDPLAPTTGLFGLQAHSGPPMTVQYKDIYVKELEQEPPFITSAFQSTPTPAPHPTQTYKDSVRAGLDDVPCRSFGELAPADWEGAC